MKKEIKLFISGILILLIFSQILRIKFIIFERLLSIQNVSTAIILYLIIGIIYTYIGFKVVLNIIRNDKYTSRNIFVFFGLFLFLILIREWIDLRFLEKSDLILKSKLSVHERNNLFNIKSFAIYFYQFLLLLLLFIKANSMKTKTKSNT